MRLYRIPFSTNVERVSLALGHKGLEVEWVEVDPADRSGVVELSGQPLVPVLEDGGRAIADSSTILLYLEGRNPERPLFPSDPARRAEMGVFIDWFDRVWKLPPNEIDAELRRPEPDRGRVGALGAQMVGWLEVFEAMLAGRAYLMGDELSAADCTAFPFLKYAVLDVDLADADQFHAVLAAHLRPADEHPRLADWIERVDARPRAPDAIR